VGLNLPKKKGGTHASRDRRREKGEGGWLLGKVIYLEQGRPWSETKLEGEGEWIRMLEKGFAFDES